MKDLDKQYFFTILTKYRQGNATQEECKFLESWYEVFDASEEFVVDEKEMDSIWLNVKNKIDGEIKVYEREVKHRKMQKLLVAFSIAAAILMVVSFGLFFLKRKGNESEKPAMAAQHDLAPGKDKAVLVLANGKKILLEEVANGEIAKQQGIIITKTAAGDIVYTAIPNDDAEQDAALLNTISTPRGGQCRIMLPDGTRVWVNSASSLSYPTTFKGNQRLVELNGEAYFEVAKNKEMPFRLKTKNQTIEVLGTHFNVNAYDDETSVKTTLLEGSVKIATSKRDLVLTPGQQAAVEKSNGEVILDPNANIDKVVAWKNGVFSFEDDDLKYIMRQIARWYDVKVVYVGKISEDKFFGDISRSSNLSQVFKILELNNINFQLSGKTVQVSSVNKDK